MSEQKEKFTPGVWVANKPEKSNGWWEVNDGGRTFPIALIYLSIYARKDEIEANAHLIAAAPVMYELIKKHVQYSDAFSHVRTIKEANDLGEKLDKLNAKFKAVLKKALGE